MPVGRVPSPSCRGSGPDQSRQVDVRARRQRMAMLADLVELARRGRHPQAPPHRRGRGRHHRGGDRPGNSWRPPRPATASCWHWPTSTRAAREALGRDQLAQPRAAGARAALQARLTTRRSAVQAGTDAQRQLHALVVAAPDPLRSRLGGLTTRQLVTAGGRLRQRAAWDAETAATAASLRALARRIQLLNAEIAQHTRAITTLVRAWRPELLTPAGWARPSGRHRLVCLVPPWPPPHRCRLGHAGRGRPDPGLQRPDGPGSTQPLRRPPPQPGPAPDRPDQAAL
jgi:hypothetical protein